MKHGGADGSHQEISGGTQQNVFSTRDIQTVEIHGDYEIHSGFGPVVSSRRLAGLLVHLGIALLGLFLLFARPELSLPERFDPGPVIGGWLLVAGAIVLHAGTRVSAMASRRRRAVWRSEKNLSRAVEALAESLAFRYDQDERLTRINDPYPLDVSWTTESEPGSGSGSGDDPASIADYFASTPFRRLVVLGGAGAGKSVLVLRLAHELLSRRTRGSQDPVPAVVSLASWDPGQGLLTWLAGQLAAEYPDVCTPVAGAPPGRRRIPSAADPEGPARTRRCRRTARAPAHGRSRADHRDDGGPPPVRPHQPRARVPGTRPGRGCVRAHRDPPEPTE
ncbi:hypothetical protein [Streptomyces sp. NPDC056291]|uniref:hypothetical protein n=1 Tax=Streptomyces sp. NPDC056291 TaxID=3345772 RepID=UPI0035DABF58